MPLSSPARRTRASLISSTTHCGSTTAIASRVLEKACAISRSDSSASRWAVTSFSVPSTWRTRPRASRPRARPRTRSQRVRSPSSRMRKHTSMSGCAPRRCNCHDSRIAARSSPWARSKNCSSVMPSRVPSSGSSAPSATSTLTQSVVASHSQTLSPLAHRASCRRCSAARSALIGRSPGLMGRGRLIGGAVVVRAARRPVQRCKPTSSAPRPNAELAGIPPPMPGSCHPGDSARRARRRKIARPCYFFWPLARMPGCQGGGAPVAAPRTARSPDKEQG